MIRETSFNKTRVPCWCNHFKNGHRKNKDSKGCGQTLRPPMEKRLAVITAAFWAKQNLAISSYLPNMGPFKERFMRWKDGGAAKKRKIGSSYTELTQEDIHALCFKNNPSNIYQQKTDLNPHIVAMYKTLVSREFRSSDRKISGVEKFGAGSSNQKSAEEKCL